jgi:hypothetical protein
MEADPLTYRQNDEPIPNFRTGRPAKDRETMFDLLGTMEVGQSIQVNRSKRSIQYYVQRFRLTLAAESQFLIRRGEGKWTKVWRVK